VNAENAEKAKEAVALYTKTGHVGIYLPKPPDGVVLLGREEGDDHHYPLLRQGNRHVLWGFTGGPDQMTAAGKMVFVAVCKYTAALATAGK